VLKDEIFVDEAKCSACGKCAESCVVAHYFDKLAGDMTQDAGQKKKKKKSGPSPL
jgi:ferredoxin